MKYEDYIAQIKNLDEEHKKNIKELSTKYAIENNPYKKGDIITDRNFTIKISDIHMTGFYMKKPSCVYSGPRLKKDLTPFKGGSWENIYQTNIIKSNP